MDAQLYFSKGAFADGLTKNIVANALLVRLQLSLPDLGWQFDSLPPLARYRETDHFIVVLLYRDLQRFPQVFFVLCEHWSDFIV